MARSQQRQSKRFPSKQSTRPADEADEIKHAYGVAAGAASTVEWVTRPGVPAHVAAAIGEPAAPMVNLPKAEIWHPEHFARLVGQPFDPPLAAACRDLGHMAVWHALAYLEVPSVAAPTTTLADSIARRRVVLEVLDELYTQDARTLDDLLMQPNSEESEMRKLQLMQTAQQLVGRRVHDDIVKRQQMLAARVEDAERIKSAEPGARGARGPYSGPARVRQFLEAVQPLVAARWSQTQLASLVVGSSTWAHPPCPRYVSELLDDADGDRRRGIEVLAGRIRDARRRAA
jgi:hypothetical protein